MIVLSTLAIDTIDLTSNSSEEVEMQSGQFVIVTQPVRASVLY